MNLLSARWCMSFAVHNANLKWKLSSIPTIRFYSDLHKFFTQNQLSYEQTGRVFKTIDPWLNSSTKTNTNACIKIKRLTTKCRNLDQLMQYHPTNPQEDTDHLQMQHLGHYLPWNVDRREKRMIQKVKKLRCVASTATKEAKKSEKKCVQFEMAMEETRNLFCQERAKTKELERENRYHQVEQCLLQMEASEVQEEIDEYRKQLTQYEEEMRELRDYIQELCLQNDDLQEQLGSSQTVQSDIVEMKHGKQYTKEVRKLYYSLLSQNIPPSKIRKIIKSVFQHLLPSVDPNELQLPSASTARYMRRKELPTVSCAQKASTLANTEALHINSDGTTLHQRKIAGALVNGMVLGVHTVPDGSANSALNAITEEFTKVKQVGAELQVPTANITLKNVVASTSDGASTQTKLNKLLQQSHSLPNLVENKCAMHLGVNLRVAQVAGSQNCSSETPESDLEGKRKHSDIDSCVHAVAKLVGHLGVPEYGHGCKTFQEFLEIKTRNPQLQQTEKQCYNAAKTVKLARQVGSRYHVTAKNAGRILFFSKAIRDFLIDLAQYKALNQLESHVLKQLSNDSILAQLKLDGLLFDQLYADLMMLVKSKELDKSVLDMNVHYLEIKGFLEHLESNPEMLLNPNTQVFPSEPRLYGTSKKTNHRLKKYHPVRAWLYHEDTFDQIDLLPRVKAAASTMFQKHNEYKKDQFPGGKLWDPDDATKAILTQLKPHNDSSESILGYNDWLT